MAFRKNFALLHFLSQSSLVLLLFFSKFCWVNGSNDCPPSPCGSVRNISYPFRLKDDPKNCGDPSYELACENNQTTICLNSKRFLVLSITYENSTVRLVDPGLAKYQGYSSCPLHYLTSHDIYSHGSYRYYTYSYDSGTNYLNKVLIYVSCSSRLKSTLYNESAFCGGDSSLSTQQNYSYAFLRDYPPPRLEEVEDSCSVERVTLISKNATVVGNTQFSNYSYGFELLWSEFYCSIWRPSNIRPTFKCMMQLLFGFGWLEVDKRTTFMLINASVIHEDLVLLLYFMLFLLLQML